MGSKKFSDFGIASTLEDFFIVGLQGGDNRQAPSTLLADLFSELLIDKGLELDSDKYTLSFGENISVEDSSWSAFFGENHVINGIFNDGIVAGEDHFSEGIAGNNAIFGRDNKLTGTGTKNFNMMSGDNNEISASGVNSSLGNFIMGIGNVIEDSSNSAIIGTGITLNGVDDTLAVNNLLISNLTNAYLGTDADGNLIDVSAIIKEPTFDGATLFSIGGGTDYTTAFLLGDDFSGNLDIRLLTGDPTYVDSHATFWVYGGDTAAIDVNDGSGNGVALKMTPSGIEFKTVGTSQAGVEYDVDTYGAGFTSKSLLHREYVQRLPIDLAFADETKGIVYKSASGHYWRITVDNSGDFVKTDLGTTPP
jgi:hypothetical protein